MVRPGPVRWRWEIETVGTIIDDGVALTVVKGDDSWEYDDRTNTYRRGIIGGIPAGVVLPLTFSAPVGPANAETIDVLIEQWREHGDNPEVDLAGEATLFGRRTQIVELRPSTGGGMAARAELPAGPRQLKAPGRRKELKAVEDVYKATSACGRAPRIRAS